jgi:hypothetical protein
MASIINMYGIDAAGNAARTNIAATNYTVPANRRLLITDFFVDHEGTTTAWAFLQDNTGGGDYDALYLAAPGSAHRTYRIPVEVLTTTQVGVDFIQTAVIGQISAGFHGVLET